MATIVIDTHPVSEVVPGGDTPTPMTVAATYNGIETLLFQWYECDDLLGTNPEAVELGTTATLTFGTMTPGGETYYYCSLSATDVAAPVLSEIAYIRQNGLLPVDPGTITTHYIHEYIGQCSTAVQERFVAEQARVGITIPGTLDAERGAYTVEIELFMNVI